MKEFCRLYKKTIKVIRSRGIDGFFVACKNYLFKNFEILSINREMTGDVLFVGRISGGSGDKIKELSDIGYICKEVSVNKFSKKYIDLFDVFCFCCDLEEVDNEYFSYIERYNKMWILPEKEDKISEYIEKKRKKKITYVSPSTDISGGLMVIAQHLQALQESGYNVSLVSQGINMDMSWKRGFNAPVLHTSEFSHDKKINDVVVATFWDTVSFVEKVVARDKYYLVQNKEHLFYKEEDPFFEKAKKSYMNEEVKFLTVSKWCQNWLLEEFDKESVYIPNCIDTDIFNNGVIPMKESCDKKRILIEGNPENDHKNVDEAFEIVEKLDQEKFEIWLVSYGGSPKSWYQYDRYFNKVPYCDMPRMYKSCDVLLKTSKLESFSYPPLEMMACGGACVVAENEGNIEYVKNDHNALTYVLGNIDDAVDHLNKLSVNSELCERLSIGASETVQGRRLSVLEKSLKEIFS